MTTSILCVYHEAEMAGEHLIKSIRGRFPGIEPEKYHDVETLRRRLCRPAYGKQKEIVIMLAESSEHLEWLLGLRECLEARRLVLVLHEENREILSRCHLLRPRYVSFEKDPFNDLLSVLDRMIDAPGQNEPSGEQERIRIRKTS